MEVRGLPRKVVLEHLNSFGPELTIPYLVTLIKIKAFCFHLKGNMMSPFHSTQLFPVPFPSPGACDPPLGGRHSALPQPLAPVIQEACGGPASTIQDQEQRYPGCSLHDIVYYKYMYA